jgi:HAD superfamily hydrolase (TIGR01509 family)
MLSVVIFDCDGVLFDSAAANIAYYDAVLQRLGRPPLDDEWGRRAHFMSSHQLWEAMFGSDPDVAAEARRAAADVDYGPFYRQMVPAPDLESVLAALRRRYRLAMATNRGATLPGVMREFRLDRYIELAVGVTDVVNPKPHPEMIEKCLQHFAVQPPDAVYVGDSETDHRAALAAGVHFVAVGTATPAERLVTHLRELPAALETLRA